MSDKTSPAMRAAAQKYVLETCNETFLRKQPKKLIDGIIDIAAAFADAACAELRAELVEVKKDRDSWHRAYQKYRKDFEDIYKFLDVPDTNDEAAGKAFVDRLHALVAAESALAQVRSAAEVLEEIYCYLATEATDPKEPRWRRDRAAELAQKVQAAIRARAEETKS